MESVIANFFIDVGSSAASAESNFCFVWFADEPECPKSLLR